MHEIAMHINHNVDDFRAPFTEESIRAASGQWDVLSPAHSSALCECLQSVRGVLGTFFEFDIATIRALPIFYFVRVAYAIVVLVKLYFAITAPGSEVGKIMSSEDLQMEYHLDTLLKLFNTIDAEDSFRPASKFLVILGKLTDWFQRNKNGQPAPRDVARPNSRAATAATEDAVRESKRPPRGSAADEKSLPRSQARVQRTRAAQYNNSTPLHFLSDVATTNSSVQTSEMSLTGQAVPPEQQQQQQQQTSASGQQGAVWQPGMAPVSGMQLPNDGMAAAAPMDMGLGFEQAIDMTLGTTDPDLASLFMGDPIFSFGSAMDGSDGGMFYQGW